MPDRVQRQRQFVFPCTQEATLSLQSQKEVSQAAGSSGIKMQQVPGCLA